MFIYSNATKNKHLRIPNIIHFSCFSSYQHLHYKVQSGTHTAGEQRKQPSLRTPIRSEELPQGAPHPTRND